jgi:LytS/YehU family sensor histidine kinase
MGYGLFNVDQRIKLSYGNDYGLHIDSIVGKGTVVTITIKLTTPPRELDNTAISADLLTSKEEDEC